MLKSQRNPNKHYQINVTLLPEFPEAVGWPLVDQSLQPWGRSKTQNIKKQLGIF